LKNPKTQKLSEFGLLPLFISPDLRSKTSDIFFVDFCPVPCCPYYSILSSQAEGQRDAQKTINESLTPEYLNYLYIKELKDRPGTIYIPVNPENGLPLFKGVQ
jgi:hypothetical protein